MNRSHTYTLDHVRKVMYRNRGRDHCHGCGLELHVGDRVTWRKADTGNKLWHASCHEDRYIDLPDEVH